jgi:hypothetical protein
MRNYSPLSAADPTIWQIVTEEAPHRSESMRIETFRGYRRKGEFCLSLPGCRAVLMLLQSLGILYSWPRLKCSATRDPNLPAALLQEWVHRNRVVARDTWRAKVTSTRGINSCCFGLLLEGDGCRAIYDVTRLSIFRPRQKKSMYLHQVRPRNTKREDA